MTGTRVAIGLAGVLAGALILLASLYAAIYVGFSVCGGDGGEPYVADASAAGRFCRSAISVPYVVVQLAAPVLLLAACTIVAAIRVSWRILWAGLALAAVTLVVMLGIVAILPTGI